MPAEPLLRIAAISKAFHGRAVLTDLSLELDHARILAIAGPSGSGKTTLARCLARFEAPDSGEILIEGRELRALPRSTVQLIFQQPAASLNPRFTAAEIVAEPLVIQNRPRAERQQLVLDALAAVGLDRAAAGHSALAFSGGERQRLAIARALVVEPKILILDESLASLDLSIQAQIANLILDLRRQRGLTCILISHDLAAVSRFADEIAIIHAGAIVERAPVASLLANPGHTAARDLVKAHLALGVGR